MSAGLIALLILTGSPDPDAAVATAPDGRGAAPVAAEAPLLTPPVPQAGPHGLTTDQQISRWLADRPAGETGFPDAPVDDGRVHGEVSIGVGTGGYRSWGGAVSMPLGSDGRLELRVRDVENDPWARGYVYPDERFEDAPPVFGPPSAAPRRRPHRGLD